MGGGDGGVGAGETVLSRVDFYQIGNVFNLKVNKNIGIHIS